MVGICLFREDGEDREDKSQLVPHHVTLGPSGGAG